MPLVADFFADTDTRDIAHACHKLDGDLSHGFRWKTLGPALEALAAQAPLPPLGVVCGAGFEDRTLLLAKIAERWPLIGNEPSVVERVKNPELFFVELARLGIPHPKTVTDPSKAGDGWLAKRRGGAGGSHVVASKAVARRKAAGRIYYQEKVEGRPVSALFRRHRRPRLRARLQRAMGGADPARKMALWRRGPACRAFVRAEGALDQKR